MAVTSKEFFRGAASTSSTTLYTAPNTSTTFVVTNIVVTNANSSNKAFFMTIDGIAIADSVTVGGYDTSLIDLKTVVEAADPAPTIAGHASSTDVKFHISGVEIS